MALPNELRRGHQKTVRNAFLVASALFFLVGLGRLYQLWTVGGLTSVTKFELLFYLGLGPYGLVIVECAPFLFVLATYAYARTGR